MDDIAEPEDVEYAERLEAASVAVDHQHYEGMIHSLVSSSEEVDVLYSPGYH